MVADVAGAEAPHLSILAAAGAQLTLLAQAGEHIVTAEDNAAAKREPAEHRPCWGLLLTGNAGCTPGFSAGTGHFKYHVRLPASLSHPGFPMSNICTHLHPFLVHCPLFSCGTFLLIIKQPYHSDPVTICVEKTRMGHV